MRCVIKISFAYKISVNKKIKKLKLKKFKSNSQISLRLFSFYSLEYLFTKFCSCGLFDYCVALLADTLCQYELYFNLACLLFIVYYFNYIFHVLVPDKNNVMDKHKIEIKFYATCLDSIFIINVISSR